MLAGPALVAPSGGRRVRGLFSASYPYGREALMGPWFRHAVRAARAFTVFAAVLTASLTPLVTGTAHAGNVGFVTAQGGQFMLNGAPFRVVSTNAYFLLDSVNYGSTAHTTQMLSLANTLGFTVFRTWAFMDGTGSTGGFQTSLGQYDETTAQQLDWILYQADQAGIRVILTLTNYWSDYGGMPWYVSQCIRPGASADLFYTDSCSQTYFKQWIDFLVTRINTYTNRAYRDDPTIFAWELANEPRSGDSTGETVRTWVSQTAAYIKSLDPNHMVDTGEEGFDTTTTGYSSLATYNNQSYMFNGGAGVSFSQNTADPNIDFGSAHLYPEYWNFSLAAGSNWIADHILIARGLGKPLVLGEFGVSSGAVPAEIDRAAVMKAWLDTFEAHQGGGALVWELICQACTNHGGSFATVYPPATSISDVLAAAAALANTTTPPPPPPSGPTATALSPSSILAGSADFSLIVTGTSFAPGATVEWNGAARPTTVESATQVTAVISAADVLLPGTAQVAVRNSDGAASNALTFTTIPVSVTSCPVGQYLAEYFANPTLTGTPVFTRCEASINYDWQSGGPGYTVPDDNFSVRWTGRFNFAKGLYTFRARSDDGIRAYLDSTKLVDDWTDHAVKSYTKRLNVAAGQHTVRVEYYERAGLATISLAW
jgi:mannan endo-1,4-beta-mannosidase